MNPNYLILAIFVTGLKDVFGQSTTCEAIRQFTQSSHICGTPAVDCCTRILCNINVLSANIFSSDFQINPCSSPPSIAVLLEQGGAIIFNQSAISTSRTVPIRYAGQGIDLVLLVNSTDEELTFGVNIGDTEIIPETTIPIDSSQCSSVSMQQPDSCFPPLTTLAPGPNPASIPTCLALQQVANRNFFGTTSNNCMVTNSCTRLTCTYLDQYPFSVTILPCNTPPAIELVVFNGTERGVLVNETFSKSRSVPLEGLGSNAAIYIVVGHPCGRSAIVLQVKLQTVFNVTLIPQTEIPIDQSNCSLIGPSSYPCTRPPPLPNTTCGALQTASRLSLAACRIPPECSSVICDLNPFSFNTYFNLTVLPCLDVPGVNAFVTNDGVVVLNETLTQSRLETVRVGPSNVTLNVTVLQSSDMSSIEFGVEVILPQPLTNIPVFPLTAIPLDRCSCPQITCRTTTTGAGPVTIPSSPATRSPGGPRTIPTVASNTVSSSTNFFNTPSSRTTQNKPPIAADTTSMSSTDSFNSVANSPATANPQLNRNPASNVATQSSTSSNKKVVAPTVVAVVLFVALIVAIATAVAIFIIMKRRHDAYRKNFDNMSYGYVKANTVNIE